MDYEMFLKEVQRQGSHEYKIHNRLGCRDAWKWIRKNHWHLLKGKKCSPSLYSAVIRKVNERLSEYLLEGHEIEFPYQMGTLRLIGIPSNVAFKEGKVVDNYKPDWKKTLEWWYRDPEAMRERKCIKRVQKNLYYINYSKADATFRNMRYYRFKINRRLVKAFGKKVETEKINAYMKSSLW
jgi:hypothetical protein